MAWNPVNPAQLAVGLGRVRNGCGTLVCKQRLNFFKKNISLFILNSKRMVDMI